MMYICMEYYLTELNSNMRSLETNWKYRNKITMISDKYEFDICSYEKVGWSEIDASSVSSSNSLSLFKDRCSLRTRERICSRTWCKESDLWSILSFRGVASPLAVPPAGVCGVLLGGMGVFVPSPVPINIILFTLDQRYSFLYRFSFLFNLTKDILLWTILLFCLLRLTHTITRRTSWPLSTSYFSHNLFILHIES